MSAYIPVHDRLIIMPEEEKKATGILMTSKPVESPTIWSVVVGIDKDGKNAKAFEVGDRVFHMRHSSLKVDDDHYVIDAQNVLIYAQRDLNAMQG